MKENLKDLSADEIFDLFMDFFEDNQRQEAKWVLKKASKYYPKHYLVPYAEGLLAVSCGNEAKGLKLFFKSLAIKPGNALAHANISICYKNAELFPQALKHAQLAVNLATEDERELVYQQQELLDAVKSTLDDDLSLEQFIENGLLFQQAFETMHAGDSEKAIEQFKVILDCEPANSPVLGNMGVCYLMMGDFAQSRECLNRALEVDPLYEPAKLTLAQLERVEKGEIDIPKEILTIHHGQKERNI